MIYIKWLISCNRAFVFRGVARSESVVGSLHSRIALISFDTPFKTDPAATVTYIKPYGLFTKYPATTSTESVTSSPYLERSQSPQIKNKCLWGVSRKVGRKDGNITSTGTRINLHEWPSIAILEQHWRNRVWESQLHLYNFYFLYNQQNTQLISQKYKSQQCFLV